MARSQQCTHARLLSLSLFQSPSLSLSLSLCLSVSLSLSLSLSLSVCLSVRPSVCPVSLSLCACETQHGCAKDGPVQTRRRACSNAPEKEMVPLPCIKADPNSPNTLHKRASLACPHASARPMMSHTVKILPVLSATRRTPITSVAVKYSAVASVCATSRWSTKSGSARSA